MFLQVIGGALLAIVLRNAFVLLPVRIWVVLGMQGFVTGSLLLYPPLQWFAMAQCATFSFMIVQGQEWMQMQYYAKRNFQPKRVPRFNIDLRATDTIRATLQEVLLLPNVLKTIIGEYCISTPDDSWVMTRLDTNRRQRLLGRFQEVLVFETFHDFGIHGSILLWDIWDIIGSIRYTMTRGNEMLLFATTTHLWTWEDNQVYCKNITTSEKRIVSKKSFAFCFVTSYDYFAVGYAYGIHVYRPYVETITFPWPTTNLLFVSNRDHVICATTHTYEDYFLDITQGEWKRGEITNSEKFSFSHMSERWGMYDRFSWGTNYVVRDDNNWFIHAPLKKNK